MYTSGKSGEARLLRLDTERQPSGRTIRDRTIRGTFGLMKAQTGRSAFRGKPECALFLLFLPAVASGASLSLPVDLPTSRAPPLSRNGAVVARREPSYLPGTAADKSKKWARCWSMPAKSISAVRLLGRHTGRCDDALSAKWRCFRRRLSARAHAKRLIA